MNVGHNRKIVISGVSLTGARTNRYDLEVLEELMDELEDLMVRNGFLENSPFSWIGLVFRYGLKNDEKPSFQRINKKYGDLPIAIEVDSHEFIGVSKEDLKSIFLNAALKSLIQVGKKYRLPTEFLERRLQELSATRLLN
ncbi:MAG: hypothetical protein CVV16_11175 [Gammaproteobacteria bacterium HGW-Gammaproteobacteria-6]|nr:MAG: hypothetical protein CVV16_11175 [Gammaproteobacteria bacterium HGW-Gammaproteobacteria-6]